MIRDTGSTDEKNPFEFDTVKRFIVDALEKEGFALDSDYKIIEVPNIVNITYGRDVGYTIEKEDFDKEILKISATQIRKEMGL